SVINVALTVTFADDVVESARITLGCVAPTIIHARAAEDFLRGKRLDAATCAEAGRLVASEASPIGDVRGSAAYRLTTLEPVVGDGLRQLTAPPPERPPAWSVLLETGAERRESEGAAPFHGVIETTINGAPYTLREAGGKTLLDALREDA